MSNFQLKQLKKIIDKVWSKWLVAFIHQGWQNIPGLKITAGQWPDKMTVQNNF